MKTTAFALIVTVTLALSLALFSSCASQKLVEGKTMSDVVSRDRIFPDGNYQHKVTLTLKRAAPGQSKPGKFDFTGIVQMDPGWIHIAVLSYFGTTAFKIDENLKTGEIKTDVYVDQLKKFEPRLKDYYLILREILLAKRSQAAAASSQASGHLKWDKENADGFPLEMETVGLEKNARFTISELDKNEIPTAFSIEHPDFDVSVRVIGYEIK